MNYGQSSAKEQAQAEAENKIALLRDNWEQGDMCQNCWLRF